ncbi:hypothetical protein [Pseudotamlana carrageenivorans]|uniref:Uncharacterized protein n=1 Tax=Pseudotamlana carrageenivorans TaxID=2069432 RepID=A0A2I7SKK6_9FLAO|nr:hypothetical protein [Tamlana carrageenivorans]AUS06459.1 hypothetical protein C1A40_13840 [Tamlana carrageenivorans]
MKIELKLNNDALMAVNKLLQRTYELPVSVNKVENVYKSIGFDLADTFDKKVKTKIKKADLFDQKKLVKFTLKFHEVWALHRILIDLMPLCDNKFLANHVQNVINKLDQKLC